MKQASRFSDGWIGECCCHDKDDPEEEGTDCIPMTGIIISGSPNVLSSSLGQGRFLGTTIGDCPTPTKHTGLIITASSIVNANSLGKAGIGDQVIGCNVGVLIGGNPTHNIG